MGRVLIIDDDENITSLLRTHLMEEGFDVIITHRGEDGLNEALREPPDLILLDVMLPDATGFQICKQLRKSPGTQAIPIIMMTGVARYPNQQVFGLERGANEYVLKPFKILELGDMIHNYIGTASKRAPSPAKSKTISSKPAIKMDDISDLQNFLNNAIYNPKGKS